MLFVSQRYTLSSSIFDLHSYGIVAHAERENLRSGAGEVTYRQLSFPRFAYPTLSRNLLDVTSTLALRIGKMKRNPNPCGEHETENR
jgi:hypothetical protein